MERTYIEQFGVKHLYLVINFIYLCKIYLELDLDLENRTEFMKPCVMTGIHSQSYFR
jgi:hypothetical protein